MRVKPQKLGCVCCCGESRFSVAFSFVVLSFRATQIVFTVKRSERAVGQRGNFFLDADGPALLGSVSPPTRQKNCIFNNSKRRPPANRSASKNRGRWQQRTNTALAHAALVPDGI